MRQAPLFKKLLSLLAALLITAHSAGILYAQDFWSVDIGSGSEAELRKAAAVLAAQLSDEELLAQTLMLGWAGADPSNLLKYWVSSRHLGSVKIFGWNTADTLRLARAVGELQSLAANTPLQIPLLVATDQEGGLIRHVKGITSETPGNMAIGASGYTHDAYWSGYYIGKELALLGINMNFAPTIDIFTSIDSDLISTRAFSADARQTALLGAAFSRGMERAGVIPTAKHFPGHGATNLDSHGTLPEIQATLETLQERELVPYSMLVKEGIPAIMSGHLAFPLTPAGKTAASLSPWFLQNLLREQLGFTGLIITDDLMMNGATQSAGSLSRAARMALDAGNDILMFSATLGTQDAVWTQSIRAMASDKQFKTRVMDAATRVLYLKLDWLRRPEAPTLDPDIDTLEAAIPSPEAKNFFKALAERSVTLVFGSLPVPAAEAGRVLLIGQYEEFFRAGTAAYPDTKSYRIGFNADKSRRNAEARDISSWAKDFDTIILCIAADTSIELLDTLKKTGKKVLVLSVLSPVLLRQTEGVQAAVAVYSPIKESFEAGFAALNGTRAAQGLLPFLLF